jgi:hypothetical protein
LDEEIDGWARRFERLPGPAVVPVPTPRLEWLEALGDLGALPQWIGHLQLAIDEQGWPEVVAVWVPRLMPALSVRLFHGTIRVGHAVRALSGSDTPSRRAELARALGYWAARYVPGEPIDEAVRVDDAGAQAAVVRAAADAASRYLAQPDILTLHGVTGAMALELLADHLAPDAVALGHAQLRAEHAALYRGVAPAGEARVAGVPAPELARAAADCGDVHAVKLVEACRRGTAISDDPVFAAAAELVTGHHEPSNNS